MQTQLPNGVRCVSSRRVPTRRGRAGMRLHPAPVEKRRAAPPASSRAARGQRFSWLASPALTRGVIHPWCKGRGARAVRAANRWAAFAAHAWRPTSPMYCLFTIWLSSCLTVCLLPHQAFWRILALRRSMASCSNLRVSPGRSSGVSGCMTGRTTATWVTNRSR